MTKRALPLLLPAIQRCFFLVSRNWQMEYIVRTKLLRFSPAFAGMIKNYALISTSTPLGRSNLLSASTVREEEV